MYWVLNLVFEALIFGIQMDNFSKAPYMLTVAIVNLAANLSLVVLMLKTEKRTLKNRRPELDLMNNTP